MEIDFSDEQIKKIEILKSNGFTVGEAIDLLFNVQNVAKYIMLILDSAYLITIFVLFVTTE